LAFRMVCSLSDRVDEDVFPFIDGAQRQIREETDTDR
jgi:hypothetical protein